MVSGNGKEIALRAGIVFQATKLLPIEGSENQRLRREFKLSILRLSVSTNHGDG
jgi:hypothetical protein